MTPADPAFLRTRTLPCASCGEPVPRSVLFCARCDAERPSLFWSDGWGRTAWIIFATGIVPAVALFNYGMGRL